MSNKFSEWIESEGITQEAIEYLMQKFGSPAACNVLVSGPNRSGKTTVLAGLSTMLPDDKRVVVVEKTPEMKLPQRRLLSRLVVQQNPINTPYSLADVIKTGFRFKPDSIVVGDLTDAESTTLFISGCLTGADHSMTTIHANDPDEAMEQVIGMVMEQSKTSTMEESKRAKIASAMVHMSINLIVQLHSRKVTQIVEIHPRNEEGFEYRPIFATKDGVLTRITA